MRTVINLYISNLALADVFIAVFCIPFQFQAALLQRWDLPAFLCKLCPFVQNLSINASIITLVVIALDRYRGIMWPLKANYSKLRAKVLIVIIWTVSIALAVPNLFVFYVDYEVAEVPLCFLDLNRNGTNETMGSFMTEAQWNAFSLAMVLGQYVVPLIMITATYGHMAKVK